MLLTKLKAIGMAALILVYLIGCKDESAVKIDPIISWNNPDDIKAGSALSEIQLNAVADVAGTFVYTPEVGTVLNEGSNELSVEFTPEESDVYNTVNSNTNINVLYNGITEASFNSELTYGSITDQDGNTYRTVEIGGQVWMAENLRTTKFRNGDEIPNITSNSEWAALSSGAYSSYDNTTDIDKEATYGFLYNWFAVSDNRNIAPEGWHIATEADWAAMATSLGGSSVSGGKSKETGTSHWNAPNTGASNSSGFTALPSGRREFGDGSFINMGFNGFWWTSSAYNPDYSWYYQLNYDTENFIPANFHKQYGFAVRCVKD